MERTSTHTTCLLGWHAAVKELCYFIEHKEIVEQINIYNKFFLTCLSLVSISLLTKNVLVSKVN